MSSNESQPNLINVPNDLLLNMINIINVVTNRGAFRAPELKNVGIIWEQLNNLAIIPTKNVESESKSEPVKTV